MTRRGRWVFVAVATAVELAVGAVVARALGCGGTPEAARAELDAGVNPGPPRAIPGLNVAVPAPTLLARAEEDAGTLADGYPVDLAAIRAQIPGNRYWTDEAPTTDVLVLKRRTDEAARWNVLFGKVQSGTATEDELRIWFAHRRQISEDAIEFASLVLADHGRELPDRDRGLLELAVEMHRTRLAELPREEADAHARAAEQARRRAAWRAGQGTPPP